MRRLIKNTRERHAAYRFDRQRAESPLIEINTEFCSRLGAEEVVKRWNDNKNQPTIKFWRDISY